MRKRTIALTGAHGFLGSRLLERLGDDRSFGRVVVLDLVPPPVRTAKTRFWRVDWLEPRASEKAVEALRAEAPDTVVHLAFLNHPRPEGSYARELGSIGTMRLLEALRTLEGEGRRVALVAASSTWLYGAAPENPSLLLEEAPLRGVPGYAFLEVKIALERQLEAHARRGRAPVTVLRLAPVLHPDTLCGRVFALPAVPTVVGFNPMTQLLGADDAIEGLRAALSRPNGRTRFRSYNVVPAAPLPFTTAVRAAGARTLPAISGPGARLLDALFAAGLSPIPGPHLGFHRHPLVASGERAARELGFRAARTTAEVSEAFRLSILASRGAVT